MEILLIRFSALGDLVTMAPLFRALRHFHAADHLTFLTSQIGKELYEDTGYFDSIIVEQGASRGHLLSRAWRLRRQLAATRFDIIYNLQSSSFSHLLTFSLRKRQVVNISAALWQKLLSIKVPVKPIAAIVGGAGFSAQSIADYLHVKQNNEIFLGVDTRLVEHYRAMLVEAGGTRPVAAVAPGTSVRWESKKWGDERYAALAKRLRDAGFSVIIVGSELETDAAKRIQAQAPLAIDCTGQTDVRQLKALLSTAAVFIGNDSGPAHIAAAVGTPTVTLFAPTSTLHSVKTAPYRGAHICLSPEAGRCQTCYDPQCPKSRECMAALSVDLVFDSVLKLTMAS